MQSWYTVCQMSDDATITCFLYSSFPSSNCIMAIGFYIKFIQTLPNHSRLIWIKNFPVAMSCYLPMGRLEINSYLSKLELRVIECKELEFISNSPFRFLISIAPTSHPHFHRLVFRSGHSSSYYPGSQ